MKAMEVIALAVGLFLGRDAVAQDTSMACTTLADILVNFTTVANFVVATSLSQDNQSAFFANSDPTACCNACVNDPECDVAILAEPQEPIPLPNVTIVCFPFSFRDNVNRADLEALTTAGGNTTFFYANDEPTPTAAVSCDAVQNITLDTERVARFLGSSTTHVTSQAVTMDECCQSCWSDVNCDVALWDPTPPGANGIICSHWTFRNNDQNQRYNRADLEGTNGVIVDGGRQSLLFPGLPTTTAPVGTLPSSTPVPTNERRALIDRVGGIGGAIGIGVGCLVVLLGFGAICYSCGHGQGSRRRGYQRRTGGEKRELATSVQHYDHD